MSGEKIALENSVSVAHKPLPLCPPQFDNDSYISILLFYQYIEPVWTEEQHRHALRQVIQVATKHHIKGRGRCAPEGLNCTLTASASDVRSFCKALRAWKGVFKETDFKITDGVELSKGFRALTITKQKELVAYGLAGEKAPSLQRSSAKHLEALEYHKMMEKPDTVIIDVRNAYETSIGRFQPPTGGAQFLDPKMRNSHEFPKWLNAPETKEKLKDKTVMMYCTGGIRCERATALLDQIQNTSEDFKTKGIYMARGGIDRYIRTFSEGGYWVGKNFLFDKRKEQEPEVSTAAKKRKLDTTNRCSCCSKPWETYLGRFKCSVKTCKVPIIVCSNCIRSGQAQQRKRELKCPLCVEGHDLRRLELPDLIAQKKKLTQADPVVNEEDTKDGRDDVVQPIKQKQKKRKLRLPASVIYIGNLPIVVTCSQIKEVVNREVKAVEWISDRKTKLFYGAAFVHFTSLQDACAVVKESNETGLCIEKRRIRVDFAPQRPGIQLKSWRQREYPPIAVSAQPM